MSLSRPTADFVASSLNGAFAAAATTATIGTGLSIPATNSYLQVDYDSTTAVGSDNGPETIFYATYTTGTGALTGIVRGQAGTTDVAHANGAKVQMGLSTKFIEGFVGARAYLTNTLGTTVSATPTEVVLDAETYDVGANFNTGTGRFIAPVNGYYQVNGQVSYTSIVTAHYYATMIYVDAAAVAQNYNTYVTAAGNVISALASDVVYIAAGSYVRLIYAHSAATTVDILGGSAATYMSIALIKEV